MLINQLIDQRLFTHHFQPVYNIEDNQIIGFEVLLRSDLFPNPELAFEAARRADRLFDLDTASIEDAIQTFCQAPISSGPSLLFINVFPSTLINPIFPDFIQKLIHINQLSPKQVVLEITESEQMDQLIALKDVFQKLSQTGIQFALDDVGKGYSNFDVMVSFPFHYIKLDRFFSTQLQASSKIKALIQLFREYCHQQNVQLVLEGLETRQEYLLAMQLGVQYAQGFFLGRPKAIEDVRLR